jgi:hypothetical protein
MATVSSLLRFIADSFLIVVNELYLRGDLNVTIYAARARTSDADAAGCLIFFQIQRLSV